MPRTWLRELHGAVLGYFVGESPPADVAVTDMGTTGHSNEAQTTKSTVLGRDPALLLHSHSYTHFTWGKITPWKQV